MATEESLYKLQLATGAIIKALDEPANFSSEIKQAVAHMADVDAAVKLILAHVGNLKAYPIISKRGIPGQRQA